MSDGNKYSRKKEEAIAALIATGTVEQAAKTADISVATLNRWRKLPDFEKGYDQAKQELLAATISHVQGTAQQAVQCLLEVMENGQSESARVSAARILLDLTFRLYEVEDLEKKLNQLEERLEVRHT